jgi:hypothetical protein
VIAAEAKSLRRGGLVKIANLIGMSRVTINAGIADLSSLSKEDTSLSKKMIRKKGGGRKKKSDLGCPLLYNSGHHAL